MSAFQQTVGILAIGFFLSLASCGKAIKEKEPDNDTRKQAALISDDQIIEGSFYSPTGTDIDYMYIRVDRPELIKGNLSAVKGLDSEILFFRKGEAAPFKIVNDNRTSLNERFGPFLISSPGVIIAVRTITPANDEKYINLKYQFSFTSESPSLPVEAESNDSMEQANPITENPIRGYYNNTLSQGELEKDFYVVEFPKEVKYRMSLHLSEVEEIDSIIRLFSEDGEKLLTIDEGGAGAEENIYSFGVKGPSRIYISVNAKDFRISDSDFYELKVTADEYDAKYELEPNDTIADATEIKAESISGDFSADQDIDYFRFFNDTLETRIMYAEAVPDGDFDIRLELIAGINAKARIFDDGGEEITEGIARWTVLPLETVYLKVAGKTPGKSRAYALKTHLEKYSDDYEKEPNELTRQATPLFADKVLSGYMNPKTDIDYFVLRILKQARYSVALESSPDCAFSLSVLDMKGIKTEGKSASDAGQNIILNSILEPGGYLMIQCDNLRNPQFRDPYKISVHPEE